MTAILAADLVGYSRLMNSDQSGTLSALREFRSGLFDPSVVAHRGNLVKCMGDGWIVEFPSVSDAVTCAVAIQNSLASQNTLKLRIGIHTGEVVFEEDDVFGNGVNVAARLEALAEAGQVLISGSAYECLDSKTACAFQGGENRELKNIDRPVPVWWWGDAESVDPLFDSEPPGSPDGTAIAVLPFDNISGDPEQEYFSDGLSEDIITALSKHHWLEVVARNTTFAYKGKSPNVRQLADDLDADYVVEGSVRKAGARIRVTVQLIDASTGNHVWAEKYDRQLEDIFDVQDEITETIVGRLEPEVGNAIRRKLEDTPRRNPHAWDCYHLGLAHFYKFTAVSNREAQRLFLQSRELDPSFPEAHAWWAYATILGMVYWDTEPDSALMDEALAAARTAVSMDNQNALLYMLMGRVQLARREYRSALAENETAIKLNPTLAPAYCGLGDSLSYEGRYEEAIANFEKAVEMSPNHPQLWAFLSYGALTLLFDHQFEKALDWAERARDVPNCQYWATAHAVVALANLGRDKDLAKMVHNLMVEEPKFSRSFAKNKLFYLKRDDQMELYLAGLAKAGIPA
nr:MULTISPECIES: tetratricopeptide repeat protein [unclassified Ruegeria]